MDSGQQSRVAGAGLGCGVRLVTRGENRAVEQPGETLGEMLAILREEIGGELIDRNGEDQLRRFCGLGCLGRSYSVCGRCRGVFGECRCADEKSGGQGQRAE